MDKSSIGDKIEAYLEKKSDESNIDQSLKADPSEVQYYRSGGDGDYLRKNICKITVNHSDSGTNDPCDSIPPPYGDNDQWKCQQNSSDGSGKPENICVPPRRQRMCIKNLENLNVEKIRDKHAFLADVLLTARNEGEKIVQNHPDTNSSNVCVALERSFADIADIIRGTDLWKGTNSNLEQNLKQMFKNILEKGSTIQSNYSKDQNYRKLREAWWNANRQKVWEVITCGARSNDLLIKRRWTTSKESNGDNKLELCRKCGHYEKEVPTKLDYVPQFLRWMDEWVEGFCRKRQNIIDRLEYYCEKCNQGKDNCVNGTTENSACKDQYVKYCTFIRNRKNHWEEKKEKYDYLYKSANESSDSSLYVPSSVDDNVKEFFEKLKGNGYSSANSYIKNNPYSAEYGKLLIFDNTNAFKESITFNKNVCSCSGNEKLIISEGSSSSRPFGTSFSYENSVTSNKRKECKQIKFSGNKNNMNINICSTQDEKLLVKLEDLLKGFCNISGVNTGGVEVVCENNCEEQYKKLLPCLEKCTILTCNECNKTRCKPLKKVEEKWIWKKYSGNGEGLQKEYANTIGLPPRTQSLCLVCLHEKEGKTQHKTISTNSELLKEWIIAAFHEGKNLKKRYPQNNNSGNKENLCKALEYSFADYGDLIKGTSIWDNDFTKNVELNLQQIFGKLFRKYIKKNISTEQDTLYSSLDELRESWWNTNKKYIWTAMKHGAGMNGTTCSCSGSSCDDIPTIDLIPQYLRFLQEWVEHFCKQRQEKVNAVITNCKSCKNTSSKTKIGDTCNSDCEKKCKDECEKYKTFIEACGTAVGGTAGSPWSKRWDQIYKRYSKHIEDAKRNRKAGTKNCGPSSTTNAAASTDENKCVQSDIDSFFKHLIDIGLTTPSSYLSIVLDENNCGDDKAPWTTYTTYTTTEKCNKERDKSKSQSCDTLVVVNVPSPLGNTPHEYKYACECRTPNKQESCDDRKEYMNQWIIDNTKNPKGSGSGKDYYELCKYNGVKETKLPKKSSSTKLDDKDVTFFNLFEQWNKEIQYQIEQYMTNTKISCNNEMKVLSSSSEESQNQNGSDHHDGGNNNINQGTNCKKNCECYELWIKKIKKQWETQNQNYNKFEKKTSSYANKGPQNKKVVSLSNFLFFSCWEEYIQKYFNGDWSKIKNIGSDTFEFLIKKCGNNSGDGETIFNKKLNNANIKCNENESTDTNINKSGTSSDCSEPIYIRGCQSKSYDGFISPGKGGEKQWICKDTITHGDTNGACIPPRTQNLCVGELWYKSYGGRSNIKNDTKESLKNKLKNAIQKETELLYEYHDKGTAIISKNDKKGQKGKNDPNGLPKGFCHAVQRSFIDYKNMILGTSVNIYEYIGKLQEDIKKIIEKGTPQQKDKIGGSGADKVNDWWKGIEGEMWGAVRCGIKTIKKQKKNGTYTGNECGVFPPTGNDEDQFVSWFKEWGEQFCIERLRYEQNIRDACTNNGQGDKIQGDCKRKCEKYKKYISEKKQEWDKQKTKYENKYVGKSASDLLKENYPECISANFDFIFNDNIEYKTYYPYGDYSSICSCEQVKYYEYNKDKGKNNKSLCYEKGNDRTWSKKYIKKLENGRSLEGVYVPPRRQQLCLYELFPIIIKNEEGMEKAKEELLETLQIVAEREAYYLWKQYNPTGKGIDDANKKACCAIRGSFYDLEDIIKGNDLVHDEYTKYIDSKLNEIFGSSNTNNIDTKRARTDWWENKTITNGTDRKTIRQLVWDAMQSGVRKAIDEEKEKKKPNENFPPCMGVEHIGIAKPQFIRWLEEWTNEFCEEYTKYFGAINSKCDPPKRADDCGDNTNIECPANLRNLKEFKEEILKGAQSEGKFLGNYYKEKKEDRKEKALEAMKNSFYDYEDIIKGTDMLTNIQFKDIKRKLDKLLTKETNNNIRNAEDWWKTNKKSIWNAMLCGYKKSGNKIIDRSWCTIPTTEKTPQFLRWIKEWGTNVCIEKEKYKKNVKSKCSNVTNTIILNIKHIIHMEIIAVYVQKEKYKKNVKSKCSNVTNNNLGSQESESTKCTSEIKKYQEWSRNRSVQWEAISERYRKYKRMDEFKNVFNNANEPNANTYLKEHCSKCPCGFNDMQEIANDTENKQDIFKQIKEQVDIPAELEDVIYRLKHHEYNSNDYFCRKYNNKNLYSRMQHNIDTIWTDLVKNSSDINKGVLIPPRRKNLFLNIEKSDICEYKKNPKLFKDFIYSSAFTEVERLKKVYGEAKTKVVHAMKYSFADIGSIIKGDDMMESPTSKYIEQIFKGTEYSGIDSETWWDMNKYHIWEAMLCGYKEGGGDTETNENCRFPDTEAVPQFLRWFQEWTEIFCTRRNELYENMVTACNSAKCNTSNGSVDKTECTEACKNYSNFILIKKKEYQSLNSQYDMNYKETKAEKKESPEYFKDKCNGECSCLSEYFKDETRWKNPYETLEDTFKSKCDCPKPLPLFSDNTSDILQKTIPFGVALALGSIAFLFMKMHMCVCIYVFMNMDTFNTSSGDTFTNKLTDDEWNQLKQDFIEQYLQNIQKDFILHDSVNEKPFITQIQDRFLDSSHEEVIYNIDWNVPENINRITNNMDDPKYSSNNLYTGTDLINDSLNGNQHMDIYDEMLKRKENELFGTYHTKYTTFNSVYKQTHSDPIINQLDLYHNWMDKHRDICEQWKTKEDMLYKLNEVWNMERKEYLLDIQPSTLDDIHKINDETYNIISTNNIYDHPSQETPLQLLGSTNIIPSYITTEQNNGLRTNISMDTYIDETNNNNVVATSIIGDDQMENSYNC
ncbi:hypothetical protein C923_03725 [Plasmodium falciparum UGT5.1]|uniref:Duffy-binding-like domain-containing protein n=3 Tax=Plasmodium falciparum TaxID=5833 RepID=W7JL58_PLAFA|nr:hypothetical protein C923_03725 [Plasmodium falciparum UGT5.1]